MENKMIDGVKVAVNYAQASDTPVSDDEIKAYIKRAYDKYPHGQLESLTLDVDGEDVGIHYGLAPVKFDRIRRITGYLVKRSEMEKFRAHQVVLQNTTHLGTANYDVNRLAQRKVRMV